MVLYGMGTAYIGHASARFIRWRPVADDMEIEFVTYATIRDAVDEKRLTREFSDGTTVKEAVDALAAEYDELGPLLLNGEGELVLADRNFRKPCSRRVALSTSFRPQQPAGIHVLLSGSIRPNVNVLVTGENGRHEDSGETVLSDGDTVGLAPGLSGGSRPEVSA